MSFAKSYRVKIITKRVLNALNGTHNAYQPASAQKKGKFKFPPNRIFEKDELTLNTPQIGRCDVVLDERRSA